MPDRVVVAAAYDRGVDAYQSLWSPVILPPAESVVRAMSLEGARRVVDIGGGVGALLPALRAAAPSASVISVDASMEMARVARQRRSAHAVHGDALTLPIQSGASDACLLAFVLFHLADPVGGLVEAARVLRPGGRGGTVTWKSERPPPAAAAVDAMWEDAGVPAPPVRRVDTGLDSCSAVEATLGTAGLQPDRVWVEKVSVRWTQSNYFALVSGSGVNRTRLALVDADNRGRLLADLSDRLAELSPADFDYEGEVVCAAAVKP